MADAKRILDVGQCGVDGPRIGRFLARQGYTVDRAHTLEEAVALAGQKTYDLVLVNRIMNLDRSPGMEVIKAVLKAKPQQQVMLVSDRPEAQAEAVALGALRGFGKAMLEDAATEELLRGVLCCT